MLSESAHQIIKERTEAIKKLIEITKLEEESKQSLILEEPQGPDIFEEFQDTGANVVDYMIHRSYTSAGLSLLKTAGLGVADYMVHRSYTRAGFDFLANKIKNSLVDAEITDHWLDNTQIDAIMNNHFVVNGMNAHVAPGLNIATEAFAQMIKDLIAKMLTDEIQNAVIPVLINGNHWVGLLIQAMQIEGQLQLNIVHNDPHGEAINAEIVIVMNQALVEFGMAPQHIVDLQINQQTDGFSCGAITIFNLQQLAQAIHNGGFLTQEQALEAVVHIEPTEFQAIIDGIFANAAIIQGNLAETEEILGQYNSPPPAANSSGVMENDHIDDINYLVIATFDTHLF